MHKYVCTICMKSKATRGEHVDKIYTGMLPGQAFGADVTGPFVIPSLTGNVYMFAIIDYNSRRVWCYFITSKDHAFAMIKHFLEIELVKAWPLLVIK